MEKPYNKTLEKHTSSDYTKPLRKPTNYYFFVSKVIEIYFLFKNFLRMAVKIIIIKKQQQKKGEVKGVNLQLTGKLME